MEINQEVIQKLAKLSRLHYDVAEQEGIKKDLQQMIAFVEKIKELDTESVEPLIHISEAVNVFREDEIKKLIEVEDALKNAPLKTEEYIKVLKVLDK